jgi:hypothetical protein
MIEEVLSPSLIEGELPQEYRNNTHLQALNTHKEKANKI